MYRYGKGARYERELLNKLYDQGYSVMRGAGSGVNSLGPDIIAIKNGVCLSFECKAWDRNRVCLDLEGYEKLHKWQENTGFPAYLAWRMSGKGWFFIKLDELKQGEKDYSITRIRAMEINRQLGAIIGIEGMQHEEVG